MKKHFIGISITACVLLFLGGGFYLWYPNMKETVNVWVKATQDVTYHVIESKDTVVSEIRQEFFSNPLRSAKDSEDARLSATGVISFSNQERANAGLPGVKENTKLAAAARMKLQDMFEQQYFEHISPNGHGPGYLATEATYTYIIVGENLAMGNFADDKALVDAWMASPGHKANILHDRFKEIGVAVGQGTYKGKKVWMAVQEFGLASSECPIVSPSLKTRIDVAKQEISATEVELEAMRGDISSMSRSNPDEDAAYEQKAQEYNKKVGTYNDMIAELKEDVDTYNADVRAFNTCIKG
ncbi:MAG: CAP domain-containing protein [Patescibacteria group bacterium]